MSFGPPLNGDSSLGVWIIQVDGTETLDAIAAQYVCPQNGQPSETGYQSFIRNAEQHVGTEKPT